MTRVLVIDDEPSILRALRINLTALSCPPGGRPPVPPDVRADDYLPGHGAKA
jgi:hypothetical protein